MKYTKRSLTIILFFISSFCKAQNYQPGYILNNEGDTLKGRINYLKWSKNPETVQFETGNGLIASFSIGQIRMIEITGQARYVRAVVQRSLRPVDHELLHKPFEDKEITDTVLLKAIVEGQWSLYELSTGKKQFFLKTADDRYEELQYRISLSENSSNDFYTQNIFRDQLFEKLANNPRYEEYKTQLARIRYKHEDLKQFIESINKSATGTANRLTFRKEKTGNFYAGAGITLGYMIVHGNYPDLTSVKFGPSLRPSIAAGYDIRLSTDQQRLRIRFELGYFGMAFSGKGHIPEGIQVKERNINYDLHVNSFYVGAGGLYNLINKKRVKVYAGGLVAVNFSGYPENRHEVKYNGNGTDKISDPYLDYKSTWASLNLKAGAFMGEKFELALSWPITGSFADYSFYMVPKPTGLHLNYHFQ